MRSERAATAVLTAALLGVGALAWWLALRPPLRVDATPLAALPFRIERWRGEPIPLRTTVEAMLRADFNIQRVYQGQEPDDRVWMYVGYYGTARGGRPEHTPGECYPASGWRIESDREVTLDPSRGLRANEYVVSLDGDVRLVHFWYRSFLGTGLLDTWQITLDRLRGRLSQGRADGALVRISTPVVDGNAQAARNRLRSFALALEPLLAEHWPDERPPDT